MTVPRREPIQLRALVLVVRTWKLLGLVATILVTDVLVAGAFFAGESGECKDMMDGTWAKVTCEMATGNEVTDGDKSSSASACTTMHVLVAGAIAMVALLP